MIWRPDRRSLLALALFLALAACESPGGSASGGTWPGPDTASPPGDVAAGDDAPGDAPDASDPGEDTAAPPDTAAPDGGADTAPLPDTAAPDVPACTPACGARVCGDDGCGGSCGTCETGGQCVDGACVPIARYCVSACSVVDDCLADDPPISADADNYACVDGGCRWLGCQSDAECELLRGGDAVCGELGGAKVCFDTCAAGCSGTDEGAFSSDNYACDAGVCRYQGCLSDLECQQSLSDVYGCGPPGPTGIALCTKTCAAAADCAGAGATGAYDADNFACDGGYCRYLGCFSDGECTTTLGAGWVCRAP